MPKPRAPRSAAAGMGLLLGTTVGVAVGLWAIGPAHGAAGRALLALVLPASIFALAGALSLPIVFRVAGAAPPARASDTRRIAGVRLLVATGAVAAAALLALALDRALAVGLPDTGWRPRLAVSFGVWLTLAAAALHLVRRLASERLEVAAAGAALAACGVLLAGVREPGVREPGAGETSVVAARPAQPVASLRAPAATASAHRPSLALIVLDTTRADHLSLYGYPRPTSPFLEKLAKDATVYDDAISPAPWTLPAHASLFTGQLPSVHDADTEHRWLDDRFVTLAEILQRAGYDTAGFSSNSVAGSIYNLHQGFARFDEVWRLRAKSGDDPLSRLLPASVLRWLDTGTLQGDKGASLVNRLVAGWLDARTENRDERPFFLFVNYIEPHLPYDAPEPWRSRFLERPLPPRLAAVTGADAPDVVFQLMGTGRGITPEERSRIGDLYDAGLAHQDARLAELVEDLVRRGLLDDTLLVIVSDHGENLGDHGGLLSHAFSVHQTLIRVPLVIRHPTLFARGVREKGLVSTLSVFATLLRAANAEPDPAFPPAADALTSGGVSAQGRAISEYGLPVYELSLLANEARGTDIRPFAVRQRAVQDARHKLVIRSPGTAQLYDLAQDPAEDHPMPAAGQPEAERLARILGETISDAPEATGDQAPATGGLDASTRDALRALGYVR
ncbi:MAG: sulfatase [Deltaproteobacteria bacterium]|nr:sulfatase [Deltaproteobacteria bacterium]